MIILASASKRRSRILKSCGIKHRIIVSNVCEKMDSKRGAKFNVLHNACAKAKDVASRYREGFVIGADTVVVLGKRLIGKPKTKKEARSYLTSFSGKTVFVYTGLCVIDAKKGKLVSGYAKSKIRAKKLSSKEIERFAKKAGSYDKAGGFSIEWPGSFIFDDIEGSFYNILGLPTIKLADLFKKLSPKKRLLI